MSRTKGREASLPVTAEVGSEGGSYADPTTQVATFESDAPRVDRTERVSRDTLAWAGLEDDRTASGMLRYPTESPASSPEGRGANGRPWKSGLVGVAAGTAALIGVSRLRRRD